MGKAYQSRKKRTINVQSGCKMCGATKYYKPITNTFACSDCSVTSNNISISKFDCYSQLSSTHFIRSSLELRNPSDIPSSTELDNAARDILLYGTTKPLLPRKKFAFKMLCYLTNSKIPFMTSEQLQRIENGRKTVLRRIGLKSSHTKWFNRNVMCRVVGNCFGFTHTRYLPIPKNIKYVDTLRQIIVLLAKKNYKTAEIFY